MEEQDQVVKVASGRERREWDWSGVSQRATFEVVTGGHIWRWDWELEDQAEEAKSVGESIVHRATWC